MFARMYHLLYKNQLERGLNEKVARQSLILNVSAVVLICLLFGNIFFRYVAYDSLSAPAIIAVAALSIVPYLMQLARTPRFVGLYVACIGLILVPIAALEEGGLVSVPVIWLPIVPLIAVFFAGLRWGVIFASLTLLEILCIWGLHFIGIVPQAPATTLGNFNVATYAMAGIGAATVFGACIAILSQHQKDLAFRKVEESENQLRILAASIPVMVWEVNGFMKTVFANNAVSRFLGGRDLLSLKDIVYTEDRDKFAKHFSKAWRKRIGFSVEVRCADAEGRIRWLSLSGVPRLRDGAFDGFIGVGIDVTERVENEAALKKSDIAKTRFMAEVSHEIRNPVAIIIGYARLLKENSELSAESLDFIERICDNSQHLLALLNDVVDLGRVESKHLQIVNARFNPREVFDRVVDYFRPQVQRKGIALGIEFSNNVPAAIYADLTRIRQILMNLLGNAVKFTDRGSIEVKVECIEGGQKLQIEVADSGIGVPYDQMASLFQPYSQVRSSGSSNYGGAGLGLVLSRELAQAMGGDVYIKSSVVGKGSVFVMTVALSTPLRLAENS